jgi:hypothetical protein
MVPLVDVKAGTCIKIGMIGLPTSVDIRDRAGSSRVVVMALAPTVALGSEPGDFG